MNELIAKDGTLAAEAKAQLIFLERSEKTIKKQKEEFRASLQKAMEKYNVRSIKDDDLTVTYIPEDYKESFDSKKFKEENEKLYNKYTSLKSKKAYITVSVK